MISKNFRIFSVSFVASAIIFVFVFLAGCNNYSGRDIKYVFLIGIDGMGISGFERASTPVLDKLVREGAISITTRGVMPTVSGPNWSSHLLGAGPEQHGITSNSWTVDNYSIEATAKDGDGYFPSIFTLFHDQKPDLKTAFFYDWDALPNFYNTRTIDKVEFSKTFEETFQKATPWIMDNKPEFSFIYIGHPDEVGHEFSWGSDEYLKAIEDVDAALGSFLKALEEAEMYSSSVFIVVTDHGGNEHGHGGLSMEEIEIPWIISGTGIIEDRLIEQPNDVFNTASTIAYLFGLQPPEEWIGQPVIGAFKKEAASKKNTRGYAPPPVPSLASGIYTFGEALSFSVNSPEYKVRFTNDGNDPDENSTLYESPLLLLKSTKVKAACFRNGFRSRVANVNFILSKPIHNIDLSVAPDEKYSGSGPGTIADQKMGSSDFKDGKWLGFKGSDLIANIELTKPEQVGAVSVRFLNLRGSWIFPPSNIEIFASVDNEYFKTVGSLSQDRILEKLKTGRNQMKIPLTSSKTKYLKVVVKNLGVCPEGHPGEGQPAWLFVDEIIVE
ncbi:MAG: alkaline phosphatase family protein [Bacteroidales bacterium]